MRMREEKVVVVVRTRTSAPSRQESQLRRSTKTVEPSLYANLARNRTRHGQHPVAGSHCALSVSAP
jgi:hypothetical protein